MKIEMNNIISVEQCDVALFISKVHPPSSVKSTCTRCVCVCVVDVVYMLTMHLSSTSEYCRRASRAYREERQHNVKSVHERRVCAPTGGETERERETGTTESARAEAVSGYHLTDVQLILIK